MDKNVKKKIDQIKISENIQENWSKEWMKNPELDEKSKMDGKSKIGWKIQKWTKLKKKH